MVFSRLMSTMSGLSKFLRSLKCDGLHIPPNCSGSSHEVPEKTQDIRVVELFGGARSFVRLAEGFGS
jgi:hypothetical protein